jgi:ADP-ribose pyrophosphatase YjhB (NUDIX family)
MGRFHYCPGCGAPTRRAPLEGRERDQCTRCGRWLYENAKPCAGVVIEDAEGRVLLARRAIEPFKGCWDLPGGFLEADEHPADGAKREAFEETGLQVALDGLLGMYVDTYEPGPDPSRWHHSLNVFYRAHVVGGAFAPNAESTEARWFAPEALPPWEEIAYENGRMALRDWLAAREAAKRSAD